MGIVEVTDANFQNVVLDAELPVLVDFWAEWCGPCKMVGPILEELADEYEGKLVIGKLDVDRNPMTAGAFRIQSIPTMVLFDRGQALQAVQGALPKPEIVRFLEEFVPGMRAPTVDPKTLQASLQAGDPIRVFDVRAASDFSRSHILGAVCVDPDGLSAAVDETPPGTLVVVVDRTGDGALDLAAQEQARGKNVVALAKGLLEWEGEGLPTYSDREEAALSASS